MMTVPPDDRIIPDCCSTEDQRIGTNPDIIADDNWRGLEPHCSHTAFCTVIMVLIYDHGPDRRSEHWDPTSHCRRF